jgi:heme/copper-type cytochrome/quinol oxidase subunit 2
MEVAMNEATTKKKKGFWSGFLTFFAMGGFMVILVAVVAVIMLISYLTR